jgi:outer membrane protein assembly factor BamA
MSSSNKSLETPTDTTVQLNVRISPETKEKVASILTATNDKTKNSLVERLINEEWGTTPR